MSKGESLHLFLARHWPNKTALLRVCKEETRWGKTGDKTWTLEDTTLIEEVENQFNYQGSRLTFYLLGALYPLTKSECKQKISESNVKSTCNANFNSLHSFNYLSSRLNTSVQKTSWLYSGLFKVESVAFVNTSFKLGPSSRLNAPEVSLLSVYYMCCYTAYLMLHSKLHWNITFV